MAITRERFEQGMTYDEYKAQMTRNRERLEENERTIVLSEEDVEFFKQLPQPLDVLVLVEDWCGDVVANVPVLARLAAESEKLNLRFFLRDQNLDLMDQYLNQGEFRSIPTFVFFDQDFNELGHWIERPAAITEMQREMLSELFATDPALEGQSMGTSPALLPEAARMHLGQAFGTFRAETREISDREVVREIRDLLAQRFETSE
ncbi:MAG: thioredoxin family protein [Chloroflexota bacterium]|nr:thioredoxin family protein [Chloroflexota bacterium]